MARRTAVKAWERRWCLRQRIEDAANGITVQECPKLAAAIEDEGKMQRRMVGHIHRWGITHEEAWKGVRDCVFCDALTMKPDSVCTGRKCRWLYKQSQRYHGPKHLHYGTLYHTITAALCVATETEREHDGRPANDVAGRDRTGSQGTEHAEPVARYGARGQHHRQVEAA